MEGPFLSKNNAIDYIIIIEKVKNIHPEISYAQDEVGKNLTYKHL